jgi:VIT1/CCC1 family predicted Fe2+/Mn2+ transporter
MIAETYAVHFDKLVIYSMIGLAYSSVSLMASKSKGSISENFAYLYLTTFGWPIDLVKNLYRVVEMKSAEGGTR